MARQKAPEGETREQAFQRVAGLRVSNIVEGMRVLSTMSADVPDQAYVDQAFTAIQASVDDARARWSNRAARTTTRVFAFDTGQKELPHTAAPAAKPANSKAR